MLFRFWYIAVPIAVFAIVFGVLGRGRGKLGAGGRGMVTVGLILGCAAIGVVLLFIAAAQLAAYRFPLKISRRRLQRRSCTPKVNEGKSGEAPRQRTLS